MGWGYWSAKNLNISPLNSYIIAFSIGELYFVA